MTKEEMIATLRNVVSDLEVIADNLEVDDISPNKMVEEWKDAKLAVEYITYDNPHI